MSAIDKEPRVRKSPFCDATIRRGALSFTLCDHKFASYRLSENDKNDLPYEPVLTGEAISYIVGIEKSAPERIPVGHLDVTVFSRV